MKTDAIETQHGQLTLPVFLPDATRGVVKSVDAEDLRRCQITAIQMNGYHLMQRPGSSTISALGGLHKMCAWQQPIITDSGGFQIYSLIRQNPRMGTITQSGAIFQPDESSRKFKLTPEKSIQLQFSYGADIMFCLDDCTHVDDSVDEQKKSVDRTIRWARRCKEQYLHFVDERGPSADTRRPLLFAVIQGGRMRELRRQCAEELLDIGFDGFGYGGWPLDSGGNLLLDMIAYIRDLVPSEIPLHALGIGHPQNIVESYRIGYSLFDSTMPTRDARHGRLYIFNEEPSASDLAGDWFSYLYIQDKKHIKSNTPISVFCDCICCANYTRGYMHHLYSISDNLYHRLATIHNLRFMTQLMTYLRAKSSLVMKPEQEK